MFFLLDVVQNISDIRIFELKDAGIVELRGVFFCCEHIGAEITVVLFILCVCVPVGCREIWLALRAAARRGHNATLYLGNRLKVLLFYLSDLCKQIFQLWIDRAGRVLGIFVNAEFFLSF